MDTGIAFEARKADRALVADIDAQIVALHIKRQIIQARLGAYKYPVLTLPNEITSEIFIHYLPLYPHCPPVSGNSSPTLLTHVCRKWRNTALATPALWRAIAVDMAPRKIEAQKHLMKSWLAMSGSCPISIKLEGADVASAQQLEFIQLLTLCRTRWEYLELQYISTKILPFFCGATPVLRHLKLSLDNPPPTPLEFDGAPLLRSVFLGHDTLTGVVLPWQQLTSLTISSASPSECTPILQQTTNLVHCELTLLEDDVSEDSEPDVSLPYLESLVMDAADDDDGPVTGYLDTLITPALRKLEIQDAYLGSSPIHSLASFISTSGCKLQELQIVGRLSVHEYSYHNAFPSIPEISFRRY
ncbi:hypothetical protein C8R43DRAFT_518377 [Mycena crocata]|nr:hypothetical protein C8R43DRAFT_518377 [Mycena crocata]